MKFTTGTRILMLLLVNLVILFFYIEILNGFFQQDEWLTFAFHANIPTFANLITVAFSPSVGHYQPLNIITIHLLVQSFSLNYTAYALISIFLHLVNVTMIYFLAKEILKENLAIIAAFFFGISASTFEATAWVLADIGIHLSTLFAVLSLILIFKYLREHRYKNIILAGIFVLISLLFKESTIGLFLIIPLILYFVGKEKKVVLFFIGAGFIYALFRGTMFFLPQSYSREVLVTQSQTIPQLLFNFTTFPFVGFIQSLLPSSLLLQIAYFLGFLMPDGITGIKQTTPFDIFVQKRILEILNLLGAVALMVIGLFIWLKNDSYRKAIFLGFSIVLLSSSIYALSPEKSGIITIMDSRNLYFVLAGSSIFFISVLATFFKTPKAGLILGVVVLVNLFLLSQNLKSITAKAMVRSKILNEIKIKYPQIHPKTVFYTESDTAYYGLPEDEKVLPFQSGFGQTLLVWYYPTGLPPALLKDKFLWDITSQGYREVDGYGFGYFRDMKLLKDTLAKYNLTADSVIGFRWSDRSNRLEDISPEIRNSLHET